MKTELKQKDNLTLLPTFLEVELDEIPSGLSDLDTYYTELSKFNEIVFNPTIHEDYIYHNFLPYLIPRLMTESIPVSIIIPCPVIYGASRSSVRSIIVCESSANIMKSTRFFKRLTKNDVILINEIPHPKHLAIIRKQMVDNEIPVAVAVVDGLLTLEDLNKFQVYTSNLNRKEK
jgi:hypothetical protein